MYTQTSNNVAAFLQQGEFPANLRLEYLRKVCEEVAADLSWLSVQLDMLRTDGPSFKTTAQALSYLRSAEDGMNVLDSVGSILWKILGAYADAD